MKLRLVIRPQRWRRAIAAGSAVTVWTFFLIPSVGMAGTVLVYKDKFANQSFSGSDGTASWAGSWLETGESDGPDDGAIEVDSDSHCVNGQCLLIGEEDPDDAAVCRAFNSNAASSVVLTFDYVRHVSSSGPGPGGAGVVKLLASSNGTSWSQVDAFPLNVDDSSPIGATYDLTAFAGVNSAIKFELVGGVDDSFIAIDNVVVTVTSGAAPTTTTTTVAPTTTTIQVTTTTTMAPTTSTAPTTRPATTTTTRAPTTTSAPPPPSTTTPPKATITTTTAPNRPSASTTPPQSTDTVPEPPATSTTTAPPTTSTTEVEALPPLPGEPPSLTPEQAQEAKENLVVEIPDVGSGRHPGEEQRRRDFPLDPREGLAVSFTSAVETLKSNLLNSVVLGVIISILLLLGIDKKAERLSPKFGQTGPVLVRE